MNHNNTTSLSLLFSSRPPSTNQTTYSWKDLWVISDSAIKYVYTINLAICCAAISLFGIVTNIINIIVFLRLGFQETINISLFGLAISDLGSLITLLWEGICYNPLLFYSDLPVNFIALRDYSGGWTHVIFTRITGFITSFITLERCLCIAFPLKIKRIMTRSRVTAIITAIYVLTIGSMAQAYFASYMGWKWDPARNRTILDATYTEMAGILEQVTWRMQLIYPILTFSSVVICTVVFVWKLNQRGKWLRSASASSSMSVSGCKDNVGTSRDQQVIRLVVAVAAIFIVCYIPSLLKFTAMSLEPEVNVGRKYENFFVLAYSIAFCIEGINASVNIFVYYKMMSKYKEALHSLCWKDVSVTSSVSFSVSQTYNSNRG